MLKRRFLTKIAIYMRDSRFEYDGDLLMLFQDLNDYATEPMKDLVRAAIGEVRAAKGDDWSDDRFHRMNTFIRFTDMRVRNPEGLLEVRNYLFQQMKDAERPDPVRYKKAEMLLERAEYELRFT